MHDEKLLKNCRYHFNMALPSSSSLLYTNFALCPFHSLTSAAFFVIKHMMLRCTILRWVNCKRKENVEIGARR